MNTFSIGESLTFGWETLKKRPLMIIGAFAVAFIVSTVISTLLDPGKDAPLTLMTFLMGAASFIVGLMVELGLTTFSLRAHDSVETVQINDLWNPGAFFRYVIGQVAVGLIVIVGLILLIVPGIIFALMFLFTSYLIVDKHMKPFDAIKESMRITKGHKWQLFLFVLTIIGINILGLLALAIGLLVSIPVSMLAVVHVYRKIEHAASEITPVPTA